MSKSNKAPKWSYSGDVSMLGYGGMFIRHVGARVFHIVRFENMDDACGEDNKGRPKYCGSLLEVDLDEVDVDAARKSCGSDNEDFSDLALAEICVMYGASAPLSEESGNNGHKIVRTLKRLSNELQGDADRHEALMNRPVNALGSTAREYARGDFNSAIDRKLKAGDQQAALMAKLSRPRQPTGVVAVDETGITHQVDIDMSLTGSDDPLAFTYGFGQGLRGDPISTEEDLADEYIRGHAEGAKARESGTMPVYVIQSK